MADLSEKYKRLYEQWLLKEAQQFIDDLVAQSVPAPSLEDAKKAINMDPASQAAWRQSDEFKRVGALNTTLTTKNRFSEMLTRRRAAKIMEENPGTSEEDAFKEAEKDVATREANDLGSVSRSKDPVAAKILLDISNTLMDIAENVALITEGMPDLLGASTATPTNNLKKEEEDREALGKRLKGNLADAGMSLVSTGFGFFEKLFAILTPFIAGFLLSFTDLLDPVKLLKQALLLLSAFIVGKLIYQLGKAVTFTLLERLKEKFISGPKVINAPNSVINAGGTGTGGPVPGPGGGGGGGAGGGGGQGGSGQGGRGGRTRRIDTAASQARFRQRFGTLATVRRYGLNSVLSAAAPTSALGRVSSVTRAVPGLAAGVTIISAPFQYMSKREEGKSKTRAGVETAGSVVGALGGAAALGSLGFAIGGPIGAAIGAVVGGVLGEKMVSSLTEGLFNFFTGTKSEDFKKMSVFSEEFAKLSKEEQLKIRPSDSEAEQLKNIYKVESLQSFTTEDLLRAQNDIRNAREKDPAKASNQNFVVQKGGDTTNNKIINLPALEVEISRRGFPSGGLGATVK